ncbi:hypothetical protein [Streptomyces sp. NPDC094032]|uniref:hypothetical protein n=1 Tax=Streptomyces sp. NPDC094032 TaxID=3155308 RepID=UPI00332ACCD1
MDLYRYSINATRGAFHYVREVAGGMLVALCGRNADGMNPLAATVRHTECRRCADARAHHALMAEARGEQPAAVEPVVEQPVETAVETPAAPALYRPVRSRRGAGHYRRPGTASSYCGRTVEAAPVGTQSVTGICQQCAKAEQRDRVAAEQVAADRSIDGPTLAERADVRYALVGTGRRVHYSNNDDTLCGREVSRYTDGTDARHPELCSRCIAAAEQRAYTRALAAASPLAAAAVDFAETVEQAEKTAPVQAAAVRDEPSDWWTIMDPASGAEVARVYGETYQEMTPRAEALPEVRALLRRHRGFSRRRLLLSELTPAQLAEQRVAADFAQAAHAVDAVEHAEQTEAAVATVAEAVTLYDASLAADGLVDDELRHAAALVTEAEATEGTWRGQWIGDDPAVAPLFTPAGTVEQGTLFHAHATTSAPEPVVVRVAFTPAVLDRARAQAAADREAYRAETDDRIAAECAAHGVAPSQGVQDRIAARAAEQAPARRVIEGVVVEHSGTTRGTAPRHSTDSDARAALDVLASFRLAEVTDHTDIAAQPGAPDHAPAAWGFLVEPRGHGRVAVYWIEAGRYVRSDGKPFAVELEIGADKLRKAGWTIEPNTRRCAMAWRPE